MSNKFRIYQNAAVRDVYRKVPTGDGNGTTSEKVGREEYTFVVEITEEDLRCMGSVAARNKNGKAVRGGLVARVTNRKPL